MGVYYRLATHNDIEAIRQLIIHTLLVTSSKHYSKVSIPIEIHLKTIIDTQIALQTRECFENLISNYACICAINDEKYIILSSI